MTSYLPFSRLNSLQLTFAAGAFFTRQVDLAKYGAPVGIYLPAGMSGNLFLFQTSPDGGTVSMNINTLDGTATQFSVAYNTVNGGYQPLNPAIFNGIRYLTLVSASAQVAAQTVTLVCSPIYE